MKKKKLTLRLKLTLFTSVFFLAVCLLQAVISIYSSGRLTGAVIMPPMTPAPQQNTTIEPSISSIPVEPNVPVEVAQKNFNKVAVLSMLLLTSSGCCGIYFVVKRELKPLEALSRQVAALEVGEPFLPLQVPARDDEIRQVAAAIEDMTVRVNDTYLMQKNFSANVAHELRTPLAVMQNKLEVFRLKEERSLTEHEALGDVLYQNVGRLSVMVDELLQLTNQNKVNMTMAVSLSALAKEAAMELEELTAERNISVAVTGDATLKGNDCLLQRLVFNLMQNAVKYNVENGAVQVDIKEAGETIQLYISDTGVGIPEDAKPHIFEPFFRVDKSRNREKGGRGLGLALVKRIVEQHGGRIAVGDNTPQGTVFQLTFLKACRE